MTSNENPDTSDLDARRDGATFAIDDNGLRYVCTRTFGAAPDRVFRAFTDPADLAVWFPSGAPEGSELTRCDSDPVTGGKYHYEMVVPGHGEMAWHGTYTSVETPGRVDAEEWFVMGSDAPSGPPAVQSLTFEPAGERATLMTMTVAPPQPEDPATFMEQSAAGLAAALATLDVPVSNP